MFYLSICKFRIFDCSFTWLNIFIKSVLRNKARFNMNWRSFWLKIFLFCYLNKKLSSQKIYAQHLSMQMWNSRTHCWSQLCNPSHLSWHLKFRGLKLKEKSRLLKLDFSHSTGYSSSHDVMTLYGISKSI